MSILIDPPTWPAHGTVFSHLISDVSLEELHRFAHAQDVSPRAFDRDHYDVPAKRYEQLIAAGARAVSGGELTRALIASGLRIASRYRPEKLNGILMRRWLRWMPSLRPLGEELLISWSEEHRRYHDRAHLLAVLEALDRITPEHLDESQRRLLHLAAWFHDAVYLGAQSDETDSAAYAERALKKLLPPEQVEVVVRLILLTITHAPEPDDLLGALLCDADLEVLGRAPAAYLRYTQAVREEYRHIPDALFANARARILTALLDQPQLYSTAQARVLWEATARRNLSEEIRRLRANFVSG